MYNILLVEDDPLQIRATELVIIKNPSYRVIKAKNGAEALNIVNSRISDIDLIILDLAMPVMDGFEVLKNLAGKLQILPVIVYTSSTDPKEITKALELGASDFIRKQDSIERLHTSIANILKLFGIKNSFNISRNFSFSNCDIISEKKSFISNSIKNFKQLINKSSCSNIPTLLLAERGIDVAQYAKYIHYKSNLGKFPLEHIYCETEEELNKIDNYSKQKATIFLESIDSLNLENQAILYSKIKNQHFKIISSCAPQIASKIRNGFIRDDLYYLISSLSINIPALREFREDLVLLITETAKDIALKEGIIAPDIPDSVMEILKNYSWPGNMVELRSKLFRAIILSQKNQLKIEDFPDFCEAKTQTDSDDVATNIVIIDNFGKFRNLANIESEIIEKALIFYKGRISEISRILNIGRSTLYRKIREYGLDEIYKSNSD